MPRDTSAPQAVRPSSGLALDEATLNANIRGVTDEEIAFYHEYGWVKLDGLLSPEFVAKLRRTAESLEWKEMTPGVWSCSALGGVPAVEPFRSFVLSERMGRNAQRLMNRRRLSDIDVAVRIRGGHSQRRDPVPATDGPRTWSTLADGSPPHQDSGEHGSDRVGEFNAWLALDEVTPEMGAMRFMSGVHREGPLSSGFRNPMETYTKLLELYPLSPPLHYRPGDMTVHHGYMIHSAPANTGTRPRLHYVVSYAPADTRYVNGEVANHGSTRTTLNDEQYPIVYR